jgi:hypothetical protein
MLYVEYNLKIKSWQEQYEAGESKPGLFCNHRDFWKEAQSGLHLSIRWSWHQWPFGRAVCEGATSSCRRVGSQPVLYSQ